MKQKIFFTFFNLFIMSVLTHAALYVNEVNSAGKWIEIFNDGATAVDVSGYKVTRYNNDYTENTATIPDGTTIAANGFLVLYQSDAGSPVTGAIDCLPYGISTEKFWGVEIKDPEGNIVDESFDVGYPQTVFVTAGKSWARETDGGADIGALDPTPGKTNTRPLEHSELKIYINEVNSTGKWIEIYNDEEDDVDMGGFTVARFNNDYAIAQVPIPAGTTIAAKGFLVLYQGEAAPIPVAGAVDCMTYGISSDKFWFVILKDSESRVVDNTFDIGFPQTVIVTSGKSWARETDGGADIAALEPSPGKSNTAAPEFSDLKIYINEVNAYGKWIEIHNGESKVVDLGGYTITRNNNDGATGIAIIPEGTTLAAKDVLVVYQGSVVSPPVEGAIDCLPYGISAEKFMNAILKDAQGRIVDNTFDIGNPQTVMVSEGESWAREKEGAAKIVALTPTPGLYNDGTSGSIPITEENLTVSVYGGTMVLPENASFFQLYNLSGQLVLSRSASDASVDLSNFPKGIYMVRFAVSGKWLAQKIVLSY